MTPPPRICVVAGDGIGPEVVAQARRVLDAVTAVAYDEQPIGGAAIDADGRPLPPATLAACRAADAVLLGAVGHPRYDGLAADRRPEQALFALRAALEVQANLRPIRCRDALRHLGPLMPDRVQGVRFLIVRELTGGLYFGERGLTDDAAFDTCRYTRAEIERIARVAFGLASGHVTSVDKANVLATSQLWRAVVQELADREFPDITLEHLLVDTAAMQTIAAPRRFEVVLTENLFGDILSDAAAVLAGSIGLLPSASLSAEGPGLYEPVHGSAPDIAGAGSANPLGAILSGAMLLRHSLQASSDALLIETAVDRALDAGLRTRDLGGAATTVEAGDAVLRELELLQRAGAAA